MKMRALLCFLAFPVMLAGCKRSGEAHGAKAEAAEGVTAESLPRVLDDTTDDLFTWVDDEGAFRVVATPGEVPPTARDVVRVTSPLVADPNPETVFVVDLRVKRPDGTYAVSTMGRTSFDRMATERRKAKEPEKPEPSALPGEGAVIYGASWCEPCHQAQAWFKSVGVPFVEHDIEEEPTAREQMQVELERAGRRGGSIPVIVWHGKVFVGFDVRALEAERTRR